MTNTYRKNETMTLLGKQSEAIKHTSEISDILNARNLNYGSTALLACDAFNLGYIYGKRAERAKRGGMQND